MPRAPRIQAPGYYHVTTRGNNGAPIYRDDEDRGVFMYLVHSTAAIFDWRVLLWCLMPNHFHLLIEIKEANLAQGMHRINSRFAHAMNERHGSTGHVLERRYASRVIESETQLRHTARYIGNNPVVAELCTDAREWLWTGGPLLEAALGE